MHSLRTWWRTAACVAVMAMATPVTCFGAEPSDADKAALQKFVSSLNFQSGTIAVPAAHATLKLAPEFRFLGASDAQRVVSDLWGNPPDSSVLGLVLPDGEKSVAEPGSWAVVLTYSDDGYVSDTDAAKLDYDAMLKDMQSGAKDENAERKKAGYPTVDIIGWAAKPHYDASANKLYWAKEIAFGDSTQHTLNYDIRTLGRHGYLSLNAVAPMSALPQVEQGMQRVLAMTEFDAGNRYGDFNASTDKVAAYGIGALVAGAFAAKLGLFAKLGFLLVKAWKLVAVGIVAVGAGIKRFFAGRATR